MRDFHVFQFFVSPSWPRLLAVIFGGYLALNVAFAGLYLLVGIDSLQRADASSPARSFLTALFFSCHTFTTTGYGSIAPVGVPQGFDDDFRQSLHAHNSNRYDKILRCARFNVAFHPSNEGEMAMDPDRIDTMEPAPPSL